jgi:hypothetical protein
VNRVTHPHSNSTSTGGHPAWPPNTTRSEIDLKLTRALFAIALMGWGIVGLLLVVPVAVTWRHYLFAGLFVFASLWLTVLALRLRRLVVKGKGRRRSV